MTGSAASLLVALLVASVAAAAVVAVLVSAVRDRRRLLDQLAAIEGVAIAGTAGGSSVNGIGDPGADETAVEVTTRTVAEPAADVDTALLRVRHAIERSVQGAADERESRRRMQRALRAIPEGVVVADEDGSIVFRNDRAEAFLEARHGDALVEAAIGELVAEAVGEGQSGHRSLELFGPPRRVMDISARPLLMDGHAVGALAIVEDMSEKRRLEAIRRDFVANISHELKTPVGALSLLAETLVDEDDPLVSRRLAERMVNEALRLANTIEDLLVLSRIESEEAPERELVPVNVVVGEAVNRIAPAAEQAGIAIEVHDVDQHVAVMGDRRQLVSALYNLLDNAVKYSDVGSVIAVDVSTDGVMAELAVADHGIGIPARDLERIFERFYRVDMARSRQTGGTGLGLSIVRHVAANHDGTVTLESRLGEGSTFTLRLPLTATGPVPVAVAAGAPERSEANPGRAPRTDSAAHARETG